MPAISEIKTATAQDFKHWMKEHPDFISTKLVKENANWGRLVCEWDEKTKEGKSIKHIFAASVDLKTGDVYLDCSRRKIWTKNVALACARPIHTVVKTLYHLSMAGVANEIYKTAVGKQTKAEGLKNSFKSLADIVRTPAYGVAMTIVNLAAVAITPFSANKAYDFRKLHGRIEQSLNWGEKHTNWTLAFCFQSGFNIFKDDFGVEPAHQYTKEMFKNKKSHLESRINRKESKILELSDGPEKKVLLKECEDLKDQLTELISKNKIGRIENKIVHKKDKLKDADPESKRKLKKEIKSLKKELHTLEKDSEKIFLKRLKMKSQDTNYTHKYDIKIDHHKDEIHELKHLKHEAHRNGDKPAEKELGKKIDKLEETIKKLKEERILDIRLTNFARAMIKDRRNHYNPFYQVIGRLEPTKKYVSSKLESIGATEELRLLANTKDYLTRAEKHLKDFKSKSEPHLSDVSNALSNLKKATDILAKEYKAEEDKDKKHEYLMEEGRALRQQFRGVKGFVIKDRDETAGAMSAGFSEKFVKAKTLSSMEGVYLKKDTGLDVREVSKLITKAQIPDKEVREAVILTFEDVVNDLLAIKASDIKEGKLVPDEFKYLAETRFLEELKNIKGFEDTPAHVVTPSEIKSNKKKARVAVLNLIQSSAFDDLIKRAYKNAPAQEFASKHTKLTFKEDIKVKDEDKEITIPGDFSERAGKKGKIYIKGGISFKQALASQGVSHAERPPAFKGPDVRELSEKLHFKEVEGRKNRRRAVLLFEEVVEQLLAKIEMNKDSKVDPSQFKEMVKTLFVDELEKKRGKLSEGEFLTDLLKSVRMPEKKIKLEESETLYNTKETQIIKDEAIKLIDSPAFLNWAKKILNEPEVQLFQERTVEVEKAHHHHKHHHRHHHKHKKSEEPKEADLQQAASEPVKEHHHKHHHKHKHSKETQAADVQHAVSEPVEGHHRKKHHHKHHHKPKDEAEAVVS